MIRSMRMPSRQESNYEVILLHWLQLTSSQIPNEGGIVETSTSSIFLLGYLTCFMILLLAYRESISTTKGRRGNHELFRFSYNFNSLSSDYTMHSYHSIPLGNNPWFHILFVCIIVLTKGRFSRVLNIQKSVLVLLFFVDG